MHKTKDPNSKSYTIKKNTAKIEPYYEVPPQFLQPITQYWLPFDLFLSMEKQSSLFIIQNNFKQVFQYNINNKKTNGDYLEVYLTNFTKNYIPIDLYIDRLFTIGNNQAKNCAEIIKKLKEKSEKQTEIIEFDYSETKEYKEYLQVIQNFKNNRRMDPFFVTHRKFDSSLNCLKIFKESFSKPFIECIYKGNLNEFESEILVSNKIPFIGFIYNFFEFDNLSVFLNESLLKENTEKNKFFGPEVFLSKNGENDAIRAQSIYYIFYFKHPNNPETILEMTCIIVFKVKTVKKIEKLIENIAFDSKPSYTDNKINSSNELIINKYFS